MGFLDKLWGRDAGSKVLWLYVRCGKCGSRVRVRVNLLNDLSMDDDGNYILRKDIMDNQCFQLMRAVVHFDPRRRVVSRELSGGEFISEEEWAEGGE